MSIPTIKFFIKTKGDYTTKTGESINYINEPFYLLTGMDLAANKDLLEEFNGGKLSTNSIIGIFTSIDKVKDFLKESRNQLDKIKNNKDKLEKETIKIEIEKTNYTNLLNQRLAQLKKTPTPATLSQLKKEVDQLKIILGGLNDDISKNNKEISKLVAKRAKFLLNEQNLKRMTPEELILKNIEFLKNILFKNSNAFNINNKKYIITSSNIIPNPNINNSENYYSYDKFIIQENKYSLEEVVLKQSIYIVFISLTLVSYDKYIKTQTAADDVAADDDDEYKFTNFITLNCEDKALLLEEQARKLDISLSLFNDKESTSINKNFVKDYLIQKVFPLKTDALLRYEENIEKRKVARYNQKHAYEISQQRYINRKRAEAQKKKEYDEKRRQAKQYIFDAERSNQNKQYGPPIQYNPYGPYGRYYGGDDVKKYKRRTTTLKKNIVRRKGTGTSKGISTRRRRRRIIHKN
jgi:hypothetical protein